LPLVYDELRAAPISLVGPRFITGFGARAIHARFILLHCLVPGNANP
jgi:hypothetical protein